MTEWNIKVKEIFRKTRIKIKKKNEDENSQLFIQNSYSLQNLIAKISILSDHKNGFFLKN